MQTIGSRRRTGRGRVSLALLATLAAIALTAWGCGGNEQHQGRTERNRAEQGRAEGDGDAYATVRRYEGVTDPAEAGRRVDEGFIPIISRIPGFLAYYWVDAGNGVMVSTSVFRDAAGAERSNVAAADWVRENLAPLLPNPPQITAGQVVARDEKQSAASMHATVRRYEGVTDPAEAGRRVDEGFIPIISRIPGFLAYYWVDAGNGVMVSTSVFRDAAGAERSNIAAADWVRENLAPLLPNPPQITAGDVVGHGGR